MTVTPRQMAECFAKSTEDTAARSVSVAFLALLDDTDVAEMKQCLELIADGEGDAQVLARQTLTSIANRYAIPPHPLQLEHNCRHCGAHINQTCLVSHPDCPRTIGEKAA